MVGRRLLSQLSLRGASACVHVSFNLSVQPSVSRSPYIGFEAETTEEGARGRNRVGAADTGSQGGEERGVGSKPSSLVPVWNGRYDRKADQRNLERPTSCCVGWLTWLLARTEFGGLSVWTFPFFTCLSFFVYGLLCMAKASCRPGMCLTPSTHAGLARP